MSTDNRVCFEEPDDLFLHQNHTTFILWLGAPCTIRYPEISMLSCLSLASPVISIGIKDEARAIGKGKVKEKAEDEHSGDRSILHPSGGTCALVIISK